MRILSINLASHLGHLAVCSKDAVLAWNDADHRLPDSELLPLLEKTLKDAKITYKDLTHIACITGPGGFTSLRVAVTLANVLAHELNIPSVGVHLSDLYLAQNSDNTVWLHSTKKEQLFMRGAGVTEPQFMNVTDALDLLKKGDHWMGELIDLHREQVEAKGVAAAGLTPLPQVLPVFLAGLTYQDGLLEPWYGRGW